jgi:hypothetical protein
MGRPKAIRPADYSYQVKFGTQKQNARKRGIEFNFSYEEWINWWGTDIDNRGKGKGKLVMARIGDQGPYHPNNVVKLTQEENLRDGNIGKVFSEETCKKLSASAYKRWADEKLIKETE